MKIVFAKTQHLKSTLESDVLCEKNHAGCFKALVTFSSAF